MPPSPPTNTPPQIVPSTIEQLADVVGGCPHVPYCCPAATSQTPPQQSEGPPHESPTWPQKDDGVHTPCAQSFEQQAELCVQALPVVEHVVLSGVHVCAAPQVPLQHSRFVVHALLSDVQLGKTHTSPTQLPLQHSDAWVQAPPRRRQLAPASPPRKAPPSGTWFGVPASAAGDAASPPPPVSSPAPVSLEDDPSPEVVETPSEVASCAPPSPGVAPLLPQPRAARAAATTAIERAWWIRGLRMRGLPARTQSSQDSRVWTRNGKDRNWSID